MFDSRMHLKPSQKWKQMLDKEIDLALETPLDQSAAIKPETYVHNVT